MQAIHGLSADLIPQRQFPTRRWFYADPLWYYHGPAGGLRMSGEIALDLIDTDLRDLCRTLNEAGLRTTPSCQGHFYPREHFEQVWCELNREAPAIRTTGLCVRDSETDRPYLYRDPGYRLPWPDFETFWRRAAGEQNKGYLGVLVLPDQNALRSALADTPYAGPCGWMIEDTRLSHGLGIPLFSMFVNPTSPQERATEWAAIARYFEHMLHHAGLALQRR